MKRIRLWISIGLRKLQLWIAPDYWKCYSCGAVRWREAEAGCWSCTLGEMIYKGD